MTAVATEDVAERDAAAERLPSVTIVCPDLSTNALGRALLLAELLRADAEVEVVGVRSREAVWAPARGSGIVCAGPVVSHRRELGASARWLAARARGELVLVSKAMPTSLGLALQSGLVERACALDIDDWEYGFVAPRGMRRCWWGLEMVLAAAWHGRPNAPLRLRQVERLVPRLAHRTVSNRWLADRFGGDVLYHVRDPGALDPARVDGAGLRRELGLDGRPWVGFVGTPRPHKGLDDLVVALADRSGADGPGLCLLGADGADRWAGALLARAQRTLGRDRLRIVPPFDQGRLGEHLAVIDVVALPTRAVAAAVGQIPAKLFDAMAMARPIVATDVNDAAFVLGGAGRVVAPGDPAALRAAILALCRDRDAAAALGRAARARLCEGFTHAHGRAVLLRRLAEALR